jgi:Family of unknown function (DUF6176)
MTQVELVRLRLKQGQKETWLKWCDELKRRKKEVLETLRNEGIISEACFLSHDGESVYYFIEAESLETAHVTGRRSALPIDKQHRLVSESSLVGAERMRTLFNFHLPSN